MKLYHGSPVHNIESFSLEKSRMELVEGCGVYFTDNYKLARGYAGSEGMVYTCMFNSSAIFDATSIEEFVNLIDLLSKKVKVELNNIPYMKETMEGLVSGMYQISDDYGKGLSWQIKNLLYNDESFSILNNQDEIIEELEKEIKAYMSSHYILKYIDSNLGLIYLVKDPSVVKIIKKIMVGSEEELEYL